MVKERIQKAKKPKYNAAPERGLDGENSLEKRQACSIIFASLTAILEVLFNLRSVIHCSGGAEHALSSKTPLWELLTYYRTVYGWRFLS